MERLLPHDHVAAACDGAGTAALRHHRGELPAGVGVQQQDRRRLRGLDEPRERVGDLFQSGGRLGRPGDAGQAGLERSGEPDRLRRQRVRAGRDRVGRRFDDHEQVRLRPAVDSIAAAAGQGAVLRRYTAHTRLPAT